MIRRSSRAVKPVLVEKVETRSRVTKLHYLQGTYNIVLKIPRTPKSKADLIDDWGYLDDITDDESVSELRGILELAARHKSLGIDIEDDAYVSGVVCQIKDILRRTCESNAGSHLSGSGFDDRFYMFLP